MLVRAALLVALFRGHIEQRFERLLFDHLEELVAASDLTPQDTLQMTWRPSGPRFHRHHSGWCREIRRSGVTVTRSGSLCSDRLRVTEPAIGGAAQIQQFTGPEDESLLILVQDISFPDVEKPFLYVVIGPAEDVEDNVRAVTTQVAITLRVLGIGLLLVVWFQGRFGLRPLQVLQGALEAPDGEKMKETAERTALTPSIYSS